MSVVTRTHNELGSIEDKDLKHVLHPATNLAKHQEEGPRVMERASGVYVWDSHGNQYIEGVAGLWCTAVGYGEEELVQAASEQMRKLCYAPTFAGRTNEPSVLLAEKLKSIVPIDAGRVFFGASGSDANDTQVKLAWYFNNCLGRPEKRKIISRSRGYHGVTVASGSLTGLPPFHAAFNLPIPDILHADCPHYYREAVPGESEDAFEDRLIANLRKLIESEGAETIAAFIAEPVMGAGGIIVPPKNYLSRVRALLTEYDILFIDDEVICGFGRTGNAFGAQTFDFQPDTMSLAKALSSAYLPLSAVVIPEKMYQVFCDSSNKLGNFNHGFTYTGHPVCAAVALRNLELMEERDLFAHAAKIGELLQKRLHDLHAHPLVGEVRGVGLIAGVELVSEKSKKTPFPSDMQVGAYCAQACEARGAIVRALGNTIGFCPPLIITSDQIDELVSKFEQALDATLAWVMNR